MDTGLENEGLGWDRIVSPNPSQFVLVMGDGTRE